MSTAAAPTNRYIRQEILGVVRPEGQEKLAGAHVALIGAGALGSTIADLLVRAGIGTLTLIDRDYVELHNLQRQALYTEADVQNHVPKAMAAAERLASINSTIEIRPVVADVNSLSIEQLTAEADFLVDGTDNFETRYLINDLAVKSGRPWIYGGVIATYGMTMTIIPGETACLRCVFPDAPDAGSAPTCDTAGVFGPAVHVVSSLEASEAIKLALGRTDAVNRSLISLDVWSMELQRIPVGGPRPDCPTCQGRQFDFLDRQALNLETTLCGHDAVQVMIQPPVQLDLAVLAKRLEPAGEVMANRFLVRFTDAVTGHELTIFPDGRAIVKGTTEPREARAIYDRYVGS
ncbi:MAG TPA: ThiF family adenylyltransferase [Thermomicrobiales bacterium]|nr:ThiF family adenylyltransferase [Thermomicrobiales bacterium]